MIEIEGNGVWKFNKQEKENRPEQEILRSVLYSPANATGEVEYLSTAKKGNWYKPVLSALDAAERHYFGNIKFSKNGTRATFPSLDNEQGYCGGLAVKAVKGHIARIAKQYNALPEEKRKPWMLLFEYAGETYRVPLIKSSNGFDVPEVFGYNWFMVNQVGEKHELSAPEADKYGQYPASLRFFYGEMLERGISLSIDVTTRRRHDENEVEVIATSIQDRALEIQALVGLDKADAIAQIQKRWQRYEQNRSIADVVRTNPGAPLRQEDLTETQSKTSVVIGGSSVALTSIPRGEYSIWKGDQKIAGYFAVTPSSIGVLLEKQNRYGQLELRKL